MGVGWLCLHWCIVIGLLVVIIYISLTAKLESGMRHFLESYGERRDEEEEEHPGASLCENAQGVI